MLKKGWKQKHKSANIEKQCQMVIFFFLCLFVLVMFCFIRGDPVTSQGTKKHEMGKWQTLINGLNEYDGMSGMELSIKNVVVFI